MSMSEYMKGLRSRVGSRLLEVPSVSIVARDEQGRILLIKHREHGQWMTPGGAIEPLETPADGAVREMWEETGLVVELTRLVGVYGGPEFVVRYANGDETSYLMVVFEARVTAGRQRVDGDEVLEIGYFRREEAEQLDMPGWMPEILSAVGDESHRGFRSPNWNPAEVGDS